MGAFNSLFESTDACEPSTSASTKQVCIPSDELFCLQQRELLGKFFKDLVQRSQHNKCIDKATFCRVFHLPGVLSDRLFKVFDKFCNLILLFFFTYYKANSCCFTKFKIKKLPT